MLHFFSIGVVQLKGQCFLTSAIANLMCTCSAHKVFVLVLVLEAWVLDTSLAVSRHFWQHNAARRGICYDNVCRPVSPSVCPSVCHTRESRPNGLGYWDTGLWSRSRDVPTSRLGLISRKIVNVSVSSRSREVSVSVSSRSRAFTSRAHPC